MATYFHNSVDSIEDYVSRRGNPVYSISVEGHEIKEVKIHDIKKYFLETFKYWGIYPENFILIGDKPDSSRRDIYSVCSDIKNGKLDAFAIVGYNDGGIFSITNRRCPFQDGAEEAPNWMPFDRPPKPGWNK